MNRATRLATTARDTSKPKALRLVCALALVYIICPIDFLPDLMPVIGWLDDALVIIGVISWIISQKNAKRSVGAISEGRLKQ